MIGTVAGLPAASWDWTVIRARYVRPARIPAELIVIGVTPLPEPVSVAFDGAVVAGVEATVPDSR